MKFASELRYDIVSKDWVVIATGRARRPRTFALQPREKEKVSEEECPFCSQKIASQNPPTLIYPKSHRQKSRKQKISKLEDCPDWGLVVIPNKYPAFGRGKRLNKRKIGPYQVMDGVGFHEVVVTRDHFRQIAQFKTAEIKQVIDAYQERYLDLMNEPFVNYVSIFHNHGREAGASIFHPHSQIIAIPTIDPDLHRSLRGSREFYRRHRRCAHCTMLHWDKKDGRRIIFENKKFVVLCPFASRVSFEVRVYPKQHHAYFERITDSEKKQLAEALGIALSKLYKGLNDPAYNFFVHTAPCDGKNYDHYHWHFEILPKTAIFAGFELGTGIEISTIEPEKAAEYLRKQ